MKPVLAFLAMAVMGSAMALPFLYESQSLYYKFGMDKTLLHWGKAAGFGALVIMVFQVMLMSRFKWLDRALGVRGLFSIHKYLGTALAMIVAVHPLLVLWSEGFTFFPLELRYWPEFLGVATLAVAWGLVGLSLFRTRVGMAYRTWQVLHRLAAPLLICMAFVHAGFVSGTFDHGLPRYLLILAGAAVSVLAARLSVKRRKSPPTS